MYDTSWRRSVRFLCALLLLSTVSVGCSEGDAFHRVSAGDCVSGDPQVEGTLEEIGCEELDSSEDHYRIDDVFDADSDQTCSIAAQSVEDGNRVVCFIPQ